MPGPTMDNDLIRDLFNHVIEASQILSMDASFRTNLTVPAGQTAARSDWRLVGQLQEWLEDVRIATWAIVTVRIWSGFFPGDEISTFYTPIAGAGRQGIGGFAGAQHE